MTAIIPNPVFGRQIPPEPFAYGVWLASAPLMGLLGATYSAPLRRPAPAAPVPLGPGAASGAPDDDRPGSMLGTVAGFGAFLAIGCPVCNKIALVALGTSGALSIWAPLQPVIGWASLLLLAGTLAWRLRRRRRGEPARSDPAAISAASPRALHRRSTDEPEDGHRHRRWCCRSPGSEGPRRQT